MVHCFVNNGNCFHHILILSNVGTFIAYWLYGGTLIYLSAEIRPPDIKHYSKGDMITQCQSDFHILTVIYVVAGWCMVVKTDNVK